MDVLAFSFSDKLFPVSLSEQSRTENKSWADMRS